MPVCLVMAVLLSGLLFFSLLLAEMETNSPPLLRVMGGSRLTDGQLDLMASMRWMVLTMLPLIAWSGIRDTLVHIWVFFLYRMGSAWRWRCYLLLRMILLVLGYTAVAVLAAWGAEICLVDTIHRLSDSWVLMLGGHLLIHFLFLLTVHEALALATGSGSVAMLGCFLLITLSMGLGWYLPETGAWLPGSWGMLLRSRFLEDRGYVPAVIWLLQGSLIIAFWGLGIPASHRGSIEGRRI